MVNLVLLVSGFMMMGPFILFIIATIHFFYVSSIQSSNFRQLYQGLNDVRVDGLLEKGNPFNDFDIPNNPPDVLYRIFNFGINNNLLQFIQSDLNYNNKNIRTSKERIKKLYIYEMISNYLALLIMIGFISSFLFKGKIFNML